jgi:hypothetical protein
MAVTITATLVDAGSPRPVQIVITGIAAGTAYSVTGSTPDGSTWPVPGGTAVAPGGQLVLTDNRSAFNVPVTYSVLAAGATTAAAVVVVAFDGTCALQSLNGQLVAPVRLHDNGDPRELALRSRAFDVPNRERPPGRFSKSGYGTGLLEVTTLGKAATATLRRILLDGGPVVVRTDASTPLERAVDIVMVTGARNAIATSVQYGDSRRWSLPVLFVDDPEPSAVLAAFTWDDLDAVGLTWNQFDALGLTWDQFDTYDWSQL